MIPWILYRGSWIFEIPFKCSFNFSEGFVSPFSSVLVRFYIKSSYYFSTVTTLVNGRWLPAQPLWALFTLWANEYFQVYSGRLLFILERG